MAGLDLPCFRLLVHDRGEGSWNMAVDHALLESVTRNGGPPVIRLYGFSPATVSVGRFQVVRGVLEVQRIRADGVGLVRRPTGGRAVLHDGEITYSVALSRSHLQPFTKRGIYRAIARMLSEALGELGIASSAQTHRRGEPRDPDCFASTGEYEISAGPGKLVGSAQIVTRTAALQHGSIPLDGSHRRLGRYLVAPGGSGGDSACLEELLGHPVSFGEGRDSLAAALGRLLQLEESSLNADEHDAARRLAAERYSTDQWNLGD